MTPEQQRELWLKRMLPALVILVPYFVFFSGMISAGAEKARQDYESLMTQGISSDALPGMNRQLNQLHREIDSLRKKNHILHSQLQGNDGFLARTGSSIETVARLSELLAANHLHIIEEKHHEQVSIETLPRSLRDTRQWLRDALSVTDAGVNILELRFTGDYLDTLRAMQELAGRHYKALPVSLSMRLPDATDNDFAAEKPEWSLRIWL